MQNTNAVINLDKQYILPTYAPYPIVFVKGDGCKLYDMEGKEYLDFLAGIAVCSLGHNNKKLNDAIIGQIKKIMVVSNYFYSVTRGPLAEQLVKGTHFSKVFFGNSGAEANETAFKCAKKYFNLKGEGKFKIVTCLDSFHGRTIATVSATGQEKYNKPFAPMVDWFEYVPFNDCEALKKALSDPTVGAFFVECIQGEGGVIPATKEYLELARKLTKKNGQLLIVDEVQTGIMRTGKMYAYQNYGIKPDIITLAKGLGGGFPISACVMTEEVASAMKAGDHGTTFGSNPLACNVGLAVVKELKKPKMVKHINEVGVYLRQELDKLSDNDKVVEVRGIGLMQGIQLIPSVPAKKVVERLLEKGVVITGAGNNTLRFVPPLIVEKEDIDKLIAVLNEVLNEF